MKTAMQELIEWLDIAIEELKGNDSTDFAAGLVAARVKANKSLEKEKEQIMDDFKEGMKCQELSISPNKDRDSLDYYNITYNQNK